jgi:hypothetical protein
MNALQNAFFRVLLAILVSPLLVSRAVAQQETFESSTSSPLGGSNAQTDTSGAMDNQWHIAFTPYLWFAGAHGTTGVRGYNTSVHASPGDLLSHFNMGLMLSTDVRRNRFVLPVDMMWIRLSDNHSLPQNAAGVNSIDFRAGQFILTPGAGYRVVDKPNLKVDGLVGLRYWHLGEKLTFSPTIFNGVSTSQNWVDALGGARFLMQVTPQLSMTIAGDAGGGAATPDYEVMGLVGLKVRKNLTLQAGWRYLDVHYRNNSNLFLYDMAEGGGIFGATFHFR